jgi:hypothetical protein
VAVCEASFCCCHVETPMSCDVVLCTSSNIIPSADCYGILVRHTLTHWRCSSTELGKMR